MNDILELIREIKRLRNRVGILEVLETATAAVAAASDKSWAFDSPAGSSGTFYFGGFYFFSASDNDFNPAITFGTANASYAAHLFLVQAAGGAGGTDTVIRVTGTSITDAGVRTAVDTEDITVDDAGAAGDYYETSKKWIGQVEISVVSGPDLLCNYGFCKYWDNNNADFTVTGIEATWIGGANDTGADIKLRHHKATGWTYNAGASPTAPSEIVSMSTDHSTEDNVKNAENGAWKRSNLSTAVSGSGSEGTIMEVVTGSNKSFELGNIIMQISVAGGGGGAGEANTASNTGVGGVGVWVRKTGVDLEFKNIIAGSSKVTITDDAVDDEIEIDIVENQISHDTIADVSVDDHHTQSHTVASHSDTSGTGAELNTLTGGGNADALHSHTGGGGDKLELGFSGAGAVVAKGLTNYIGFGSGVVNSVEANAQWLLGNSNTGEELHVYVSANGTGAANNTIIINIAGVNTALSVAFGSGVTGWQSITGQAVAFTAGDLLSIEAVNQGSGGGTKNITIETVILVMV